MPPNHWKLSDLEYYIELADNNGRKLIGHLLLSRLEKKEKKEEKEVKKKKRQKRRQRQQQQRKKNQTKQECTTICQTSFSFTTSRWNVTSVSIVCYEL